jgi:glycosyltransferase involved in cell wall biosynthesis
MRVLQLGKFYPPDFGGIETVTQMLTEGLNAAGVRCDVLCASSGQRTVVREDHGHRVVRAGSFGTIFSVPLSPALVWWLWKSRSDYEVIHVHVPNPLAELAVYLVRPRGRITLHWHGDVDVQKFGWLAKLYAPLTKWLINRSSRVIAATSSHIACSSAKEAINGKDVVIPYPFGPPAKADIGKLDEDEVRQLAGRFVIYSVGRLIYYKGFKYLVDTARRLPPDCLVVIAGTGPLQGELQAQIDRAELTERVMLLGRLPLPKLMAYFAVCDLFCFPSVGRGEMFGMVQLEAMSFGKPVVGTRIPGSGVHEVNVDGVTGLLVPIMEPDAMAEAIVRLKDDPGARSAMGLAGRRRVSSLYDRSVVIPQFVEMFRACVNA